MADPKSGRPVDADLRFYGAVMKRVASPQSTLAEIRTNVYFILCLLAALYGAWSIWDRFEGSIPSKVNRIAATNSPVPQGGVLHLQVDLQRNRICERDYELIFSDHTGHRERITQAHMHAIGSIGPDSFIEYLRLPENLEPGAAKVRVIWSWQCPENLFETIYPKVYISPEIRFEIGPKP